MEQAVKDVTVILGERRACNQLGIARSTFQRHQVIEVIADETTTSSSSSSSSSSAALCESKAVIEGTETKPSRQLRRHLAQQERKAARSSFRALTPEQRQELLDAVHEPRFTDRSIPYIYATLLDENHYYGSISTMYRVLRSVGEVGDRRDQATRPAHVKPELCATRPNQVWSWDITKLHGPQKWTYYYLYAVIDIYSRYVVGWMVADRESSALAKLLLETTIREQRCDPRKLTIHADRGSSMKSKPLALMLADLGVTKTHSRPHVSNDNPYIESLFKTTKYQPEFPQTFANIAEARSFCRTFYRWYNSEHRHSGIALFTPSDVHYGRVEAKSAIRQTALDAAYAKHPERFVRGRPKPLQLAPASYINRPTVNADEQKADAA